MGVARLLVVHSDLQSVTVVRACLSRALHPVASSNGLGPRGRANEARARLEGPRRPLGAQPVTQPVAQPGSLPEPQGADRVDGTDAGPTSDARAHAGRREPLAVVAEHVLLTTDGSTLAGRAVPMAIAAIEACASPRVTVLRVLTHHGEHIRPVQALEWELARAHAEADLRQLATRLDALRGDELDRMGGRVGTDRHVDQVIAEGRAAEQILHYIEAGGVDLVVMAAHGSDDARGWPMGSVARKVIGSGLASILIVPSEPLTIPDPGTSPITRVLVPLDCSARAECVLPLLGKLARAHDPEFVLMHVVPRPEVPHRLPAGARDRALIDELTRRSSERADAYLHDLRERLVGRGARVQVRLEVDDHPARAIERYACAQAVDLIVVSAHGAGAHEGDAYGTLPRRLLDTMVTPLWVVQDLPQRARPLAQDELEARDGRD